MFPRRFSLRSMLVVITILAVVGSWIGTQLSWIRERRTLRAEGLKIYDIDPTYVGPVSEKVSPLGSTLSQRILQLFGEGPVDQVYVFYFVSGRVVTFNGKVGIENEFEVTDYPKIQRARSLFPEATIMAVDVQREEVKAGGFLEWAGMVSE